MADAAAPDDIRRELQRAVPEYKPPEPGEASAAEPIRKSAALARAAAQA
jgi:hypothetical protein